MNIKYINELLKASTSNLNLNHEIPFKNENEIIRNIQTNQGFYAFEGALHFFSKNDVEHLKNFIENNNLYPDISRDCVFFAEDLFGNLFCKTIENKYYLFDLETGDLEYISNSFESWAEQILEDYNYLTGYSLAHSWQKKYGQLKKNHRLIPIKPFVMGGEYTIDNLMAVNRIDGLFSRHKLYQQIKDIPDNSKVIIDVTK
jgi:hypothetical protein